MWESSGGLLGFGFFLEFYLSEEKSLKSFDLFKIFCMTGFSCDLIIWSFSRYMKISEREFDWK